MCQPELLRVCTNGRPSRKQSAEISYWRRNDDMRRRDGTAHAGSKKSCRVTGASKPAPRHPSSPQRLCSSAGPRHQPQLMHKETAAPDEESTAVGGRNACGSEMPLCLDMARSHVTDPGAFNEKTFMLRFGRTEKVWKTWLQYVANGLTVVWRSLQTENSRGVLRGGREAQLHGASNSPKSNRKTLLSRRCCVLDPRKERHSGYQNSYEALDHE